MGARRRSRKRRKQKGRSATSCHGRPGAWPVTIRAGHHPGRPTGPDDCNPAPDSPLGAAARRTRAVPNAGRSWPRLGRSLTAGGCCPRAGVWFLQTLRAPRAHSVRRETWAGDRLRERSKKQREAVSFRPRHRAAGKPPRDNGHTTPSGPAPTAAGWFRSPRPSRTCRPCRSGQAGELIDGGKVTVFAAGVNHFFPAGPKPLPHNSFPGRWPPVISHLNRR